VNVLKEADQARRNLNVTRTAIKFRQISFLGSRSNIEDQQLQRARDNSILSTSGPGGLEEIHAQQVIEAEIVIGKVEARNAIDALRAGLWHRRPATEVAEAASHLEATRIHLLELVEHRADLETEDIDLQFLQTEIANISAEALAYIKENTPAPTAARPPMQSTTPATSTIRPPSTTSVAAQFPINTVGPASGVSAAIRPPVGTQPPTTFHLPGMNVPPPNHLAQPPMHLSPHSGPPGSQAQRPVATHNLTMYQAFNVGEAEDDVGGRSLNDTTYAPETSNNNENHDPNATFRPEDHQTETLDTLVSQNDLTIDN
jgi:hypothetical protein